jgi:hypothetical protein
MIDFIKLFSTFNNVKYYDIPHKYYVDGIQYTSVTTLLHKFTNEFDSDYWSQYKANEYGKTQQEVLDMWKLENKISTVKGSLVHKYAEDYLANKVFDYPQDHVIKELGSDLIQDAYNKSTKQFESFHKASFGKLIPIKSEFIVYDTNYKISGMVDQLFYNVKYGCIDIYDWKTNKEIKTINQYQKMLLPVNHLDDCNYYHYSLQLNLYKWIIEKNTGIKIGNMCIVWLNQNNNDFQVYKLHDMQKEIESILKYVK